LFSWLVTYWQDLLEPRRRDAVGRNIEALFFRNTSSMRESSEEGAD
jgi:hypothetical protein